MPPTVIGHAMPSPAIYMLRLPAFCTAPAPAASSLPLPALKHRLISHHNHSRLHACTCTRTRLLIQVKAKGSSSSSSSSSDPAAAEADAGRRQVLMMAMVMAMAMAEAEAEEEEEEYARETKEVIAQVRDTVEVSVAADKVKVSEMAQALRESSNNWVAKYRRQKKLAGRPSFSNMYSVLNAISGHYISFGPSAPIPSKRKARILEELDLAEKALSRGR